MKSIRVKLLVSFLVVIVIFLITIIVQISENNLSTTIGENILNTDNALINHIQDLTQLVIQADDLGARYLMASSSSVKDTYLSKYQNTLKQINSEEINLQHAINLFPSNERATSARLLQTFESNWSTYMLVNNENMATFFNTSQRLKAQVRYTNVPLTSTTNALTTFANTVLQHQKTSETSFLNAISFSKTVGIIGPIIATIAALLLSYWLSQRITKNIKKIVNIARLMAMGKFNNHQDEVKTKDETGELTDSFYQMQNAVAGLIRELQNTSEDLNSVSSEINNHSEQVAASSIHLAQSSLDVTEVADEQSHLAITMKEAVNQLLHEIQEVFANASTTDQLIQFLVSQKEQGNTIVADAIAQMNAIRSNVDVNYDRIERLSQRSNSISNIIQLINEIAEQTNLLALNAAIEAARAGDHGKGFAVVADEVRKLAEETKTASTQISKLIDDILHDMDDSVNSADEEKKQVVLGSTAMQQVNQIFTDIAQSIGKISSHVSEVIHSTESMTDNANGLSKTANEMTTLSERVTSEIGNVSAIAEEQSASTEEMTAASDTLKKYAELLQLHAGKFEVEDTH